MKSAATVASQPPAGPWPVPSAHNTAAPSAAPRTAAPRARFEQALTLADIKVNGPRPWDLQVHDERLFARVRSHGLTGLGDAYIDGWWDCDALDQMFSRALVADLPRLLKFNPDAVGTYLKESLLNLQSKPRAARNIERHYNLGNDLFQATLDPLMLYTCGYWKDAATLDQAQINKLDLACRKLGLKPGMRVLDLGCGWAGFGKYAAAQYGVSVVGVTLSDEQVKFGREVCRGLPVDLRLMDYRDLDERFDRVVSLGMVEHIGPKNYRTYMRVIDRVLNDGGLALLQFIASRDSFPNLHRSELNWITRHIFPGGVLPSLAQFGKAIDNLFVVEDLHNFGAHYEPTLLAWAANFERNWEGIKDKYGPQFYRMWRYYLLSCAGVFRARRYQLWQIVLSKNGVPGGYESVR